MGLVSGPEVAAVPEEKEEDFSVGPLSVLNQSMINNTQVILYS
jgi:hypothetical protein